MEGLVVVGAMAHQLLVDVLHVEAGRFVEELPLGEDALEVALGRGVIGVVPLLVLLHEISRHGQLLDALLAVGQHVAAIPQTVVSGGLWSEKGIGFKLDQEFHDRQGKDHTHQAKANQHADGNEDLHVSGIS